MATLHALRIMKSSGVAARSRCLSFNQGVRMFYSSPRCSEQYPKADLDTFTKVTNAKDRVVLVDFYADWCGPCHQLSPILESLTSDPTVKSGSGLPLDLVKIDTDGEHGLTLGQRFKVRALPTVIAFRNGEAIHQFVGALNEPGVRNFLEKV